MGINLEYATLLARLKAQNNITLGGTCCEFGAQDISADPVALAAQLKRCGINHAFPSIDSAAMLYSVFNYSTYTCIDATAEHKALVFDLNKNLREHYGFKETYDLVTDIGTFEHVFNIATAFENAHDLCAVGGTMIHVLPSNCNTNHGYYTIQPRLIADIVDANAYEIIDFLFTVDYKPVLYAYDLQNYKAYDDRDIMFYVVLRKTMDKPFQYPFDSIFTEKNTLSDYKRISLIQSFSSYIKSSWSNIRPQSLNNIPTDILASYNPIRKWIKKCIDHLGRY